MDLYWECAHCYVSNPPHYSQCMLCVRGCPLDSGLFQRQKGFHTPLRLGDALQISVEEQANTLTRMQNAQIDSFNSSKLKQPSAVFDPTIILYEKAQTTYEHYCNAVLHQRWLDNKNNLAPAVGVKKLRTEPVHDKQAGCCCFDPAQPCRL